MKKRDWYKRLWISLTLILLIGLLTGCNTAVEHNTNDTKTDHEKKQTLQEELDALVSQLALENTVGEMIDVSQNADIDKFPDELVRRMQEALVAGTSDALLEELDDSGLRISREDFDYEPREGGELSYEEERVNTAFADRSKTASYDFYQLDMDQDGLDEIIMMEHTQYEFSGSSRAIVLEQNDAGSYMFAGGGIAGYYRLYAIFSYEGTYYMICNYDDYKREATKALGLFDLSGEARGSKWHSHQEHIYLRRSSTDCEIESLWTTEQDSAHTEAPDLQSSMWTYIREIGLDLMLRNQNSESFQGAEKGLSEQEQDRLTVALDDASWTPAHLGYAPQEQKWLFMLEEQPVYFALYYKEQPDRYLVEAFLYKEDSEKSVLEPIALYEIKPQIRVVVEDYWDFLDHKDRNVETICYQSEDASLAFPENRKEVAAQLLQQVQGEFQPAAEQSAEDIVPDELVLLAQKALFTRDWSLLNALAAPLELTDYEAVSETWFAIMDLDDFQRYVCHIYQYNIDEKQFLIVVRDSGGSARIADIYCYCLAEDGPEYIDRVPTLDMGARVVPYEGGFYLVNICYNYYSKYTDTIYLYPLTSEGISEQAIEVTLLPADYIWTKGYQSNTPVLEQINSYVESVQRELMEASPINDNITVFTGCEEPVTDPVKLQRLSNSLAWYMVDYDNDGRREYQGRYYWFPSNSTTLYLITEEYRLEDITLKLQEKWELECPYRSSYGYELIQRWYQEFDGKIYTFQLFLTEGYNYYLNVSLWEGEHISWIASYYVTPRCELQTQIVGQETTGMG